MEKHVPNLLAALWAWGFFVLLLAGSKLVRPERPQSPDRNLENRKIARAGFNSGELSSDRPWIRMSARYQLLVAATAMFFLGALLLYPAVATFRRCLDAGHGVAALGAVGMFLGTFSVALAYAWMKGDLSWIKDKEDNGNPRERIS